MSPSTLTDTQRQQLIDWLTSMPWWEQIRDTMLQHEENCIIYMGNKGYGRKPYRLSLSHQVHDFEELAKKEGFKVIEKIPVNTERIETVWGDLGV